MDHKVILRKLEREVKARKAAESILESKALELYEANESLKKLNETLEGEIELRTRKMLSSEQQYKDLVETMDEVIYHADVNGYFIFMNHNGPARFGYNHEEMLGKHFSEFILQEDIERTQSFYTTMINDNKDHSYHQFRISSKTGQIHWIGQSVKAIKEDGKVVKFAAVARDITERKKLMDDLNEAKEIAESSQLAEKQFLANMSHEIRTPLNAIIGMSHLLNDTKLAEDQKEYVDILLNSSKILHSLITDVLDISKIEAGHLETNEVEFDLRNLLKTLEKTFIVKLENKNIRFNLELDDEINTILIGDANLLNQVFFNLLGNAEKFTDRGDIFLKAKVLNKTEDSLKIFFEVKDTGIGISKDNLNTIFEKFKQVGEDKKYSHGGTGLGLPITKNVVSLLGGNLQVESIQGLGTVFHFEISLQNTGKAIVETKNLSIPRDVIEVPKEAILIAEDNPMNQKYIRKLLDKWKLNFEFANNGEEAVQKCKEKKYALIFMDIQMPILDGFEATKKIREETNLNQATAIVALTASSLLSIKNETKAIGMDGFLSKPFTPIQLMNILSDHFPSKAQKDSSNPDFEGEFRFNSELNENYLADNYAGDLEYALDMFETFLETFNKDYAVLNENIQHKNLENCAKLAHKIKPIFTMVGLNKISEHFESLENIAKTKNWEGFISYHRNVEHEISNSLALIKVETSRLKKFLKPPTLGA